MKKIDTQTLFIVNPRAGNGAAGRKIADIRMLARKFFPEFQMVITEAPGQAVDYAAQALQAAVVQVICVGGDGTLNEVINGLMSIAMDKSSRPQLGYIPLGTGSDLVKTIGITTNIENGLRDIAAGSGKWIDVGRATFTGHDKKITSRYFINALSFALGGEVVRRVEKSGKGMGGFMTFLLATLGALVSYRKPMIRLKIDEKPEQKITCWHVAVANGQYQGGGMRVAPDAKVDDGRLGVTVVGDLSLPAVVLNLPRLYDGGIYSVAKVSHFSGRKITAESATPVLLDIDGEAVGRLPVKVEVLPLALWLIY